MAAGIGGRTVQEAKANLSYKESQNWLYYVSEKGPQSSASQLVMLRNTVEYVGAKICWAVLTGAGHKNVKLDMFLPEHLKSKKLEVEDQPVGDINQVLRLLNSVRKRNG